MYAARGSPYKSLQQGSGAILPYGDCLLLLALQDALRELSAQAFIRHDAAETIAATAQQEFVAHLVRLAPSLPSICLSGQLLLYRYRQQRWLLVLQRVHGAVISPSPQRKSPLYPVVRSVTASQENLYHANRVDIAVGYLRRQRKAECLPVYGAGGEAAAKATPKYNLKSLLLGETSGHPGRAVRAAHGSSHRGLPQKPEGNADGVDELEASGAAGASDCISGAAGAVAAAALPGTAPLQTVNDERRAAACGNLSMPPALEGVSYFRHDGPIRASVPFLHAQQVTRLIGAALETSRNPGLYSQSARPSLYSQSARPSGRGAKSR